MDGRSQWSLHRFGSSFPLLFKGFKLLTLTHSLFFYKSENAEERSKSLEAMNNFLFVKPTNSRFLNPGMGHIYGRPRQSLSELVRLCLAPCALARSYASSVSFCLRTRSLCLGIRLQVSISPSQGHRGQICGLWLTTAWPAGLWFDHEIKK